MTKKHWCDLARQERLDEEGLQEKLAGDKLYRYWVLTGLRQSKDSLQKDCDKKDSNKKEYKRQMRYLRRQIIWHYLKNIFLFPIWFVRILTPSFFRGTPNIWINLKLIFTKKEFHPLRMAMLSWLVFSYLLVQGGVLIFRRAPPAKAATFTFVQTSWSGGDSTVTSTHDLNRTGWDKYSSASSSIYFGTAGQITLLVALTDDDNNATTGFAAGTHSNTQWDAENNWLELDATGLSSGAGNFTSRILDAGMSTAQWVTSTITHQRPYSKELPNNFTTETAYLAGNVEMRNNMLLFHMNETGANALEAGTISDSSGAGNNGTLNTGSDGLTKSSSTAQFNTSLQFDGGDDQISVADANSLDMGTSFSISAWVKSLNVTSTPGLLNTTNRHIVSKNAGATGYQLGVDTSNKPYFGFEDVSVNVISKYNNTIEAASNTTGTQGRIPIGVSGGDTSNIYDQTVIKDGSTYKMWYTGNNGTFRIYYATSPDGLTWTKNDNSVPTASDTTGTNGRIPIGTNETGDDFHVHGPNVIKDGSTYKMWYAGYDGANWRIYYATSPDGLTWTKQSNSVPTNSDTTSTNGKIPIGSSGKGDDVNNMPGAVIKDGSTYKIWYRGDDGTNSETYYATLETGATSTSALSTGWNHLTGVVDGTSVKLYVNGVLDTSTTTAVTGVSNAGSLLIGTKFEGAIDELAVFNRVLSATEIADIYKRGALKLKYQVRTCDDAVCSGETFVGPNGTATDYYDEGDTNATTTPAFLLTNLTANRYLQYKAFFETASTTLSPELKAISLLINGMDISYNTYPASSTLVSSVFDSISTANIVASIAWSETLPVNTDIKFQIRTSADGNTWTDYLGPAGANDYYTNPAGGETINSSHRDGVDDKFVQYKVWLNSITGANTPTLSDITLTYVVNATPEISGSGVTATQNSNGTVTIVYSAYDPDGTVALGDGDGVATPSFQYSLNGTSTSTIVSGLTDSGFATATTTRDIGTGWVTSTVIWTPKNEIDGQYTASAQIKVIINDGEAANSTVSSTSPSFALDVKNPVAGSPAIIVIATTTPATLRLSASDDSSFQMALSLNSDMAGAVWESYSSTSTITVDTSPDTVYAQFRDSFANTSTIQSVSTPATPTNMVIRDISNINTSAYKEFFAWAVVALPTPGWSRYDLYSSVNGGAYTLLISTTDRMVNYYVDTDLTANITYAYKIAAVDSNGNASQFSSIVSDNADGQGGTDLTPPTITNVNVPISSITTQGFTVTWDTDEISSSSVAYSATTFGPTFTTTTVHTMTHSSSGVLGGHSVTLSGLTPGVEYFFQVASGDPSQNIVYKNNDNSGYSATTLSGPTISGTAVDSVDNTQAAITWNSSASADSTVYYSTSATMAGALNVTSATLTTAHSLNITNLTQGTRYYFYVTSGNATDNNAGSYYTFTTTADTTAPTITSIAASPVADTTAVITWTTNESATTQVNYGATSGALTSYSTPATGLNLNHIVSLAGLTANTKYYYTVASLDGSKNATTSTENNFTTLQTLSEEAAVVAREATATAAGREAAGGGGGFPFSPTDNIPPVISNVKANNVKSESATVSWNTNEASYGVLEYDLTTDYKNAVVNFTTLLNIHYLNLANLKPASKYNYRVRSIDKSGNIVTSGNQTFTTISGFEEIDTLQQLGEKITPEAGSPESVFNELIGKTADIIKRLSGQVSIGTLESGLATQYATIKELGRLVPLPLIGGQPVVEVGGSYARIFWTTDKSSNSLVALAPDSTYQNNREYTQVIGDAVNLTENHEVLISELKPNMLYHYQVRSKTPVSDTAKSRDFTLKTKQEQIEIITYKVDKVSDTEAQFTWTTNIPTDSKVVYIPYGQDGKIMIDALKTSYDKNVTTAHEVKVKDMEGGQVYQVELSGEDGSGNIVSKTISTFSTSEIDAPPVITQVQTDSALIPGAQTSVQAIISWITNEPATSQVFYQKGFGKTDEKKEFAQKTSFDQNYVKRHILVITNFDPGAVYQFQAESIDSSGNITRSKTYTILTPRQKESVFQVIVNNIEETFSWVGQLGL